MVKAVSRKITSLINEVIDADVLVVGGGLAGCMAAIKAKDQGVKVVLVDKGYISRSGQSPFAAGSINIFTPEDDLSLWLREIVERGEYLNDQEWVKLQLENIYSLTTELDAWGKEYGLTVLERDEKGSLLRRKARGNINTLTSVINALPMMDTLRRRLVKLEVPLYERIMVTDLLTEDGRVVGALGLNYRDGKLYLFRAKATILAAAGCGFKSFFIGHRNLTGEGQVMAYQLGAALRNLDQAMSNTTAREVDIHGLSFMVGFGGRFLNGRGEEFMWRYDPEVGNRARLTRLTVAMAREVAEGRGPIYMDLTQVPTHDQTLLKQIVPEGFRSLESVGLKPFREKIEWMPAFEGTLAHGGGVHIDLGCATGVPGLFAAGDNTCTPEHGTWSITGLNLSFCIVSGKVAADSAVPEASRASLSALGNLDVAPLVDALLAPLDREGGSNPEEVIARIQQTIIPYPVAYLRREETLQNALARIQNTRQWEIPRLRARNLRELVKAREVRNMALIAEAIVQSALYRQESRGFHYREDYPLTDNDQWLKWIMVKEERGEMKVRGEVFPTPYIQPPTGKYPPR
ncbi:MAG: FAD-binding protein [Chloroflexi bacterium]|nr:FAD-binding protein [Chloroflexota bacterium]